MSVERDDQHRRPGLIGALGLLQDADRMLQRRVVQLHDVFVARYGALQAAGQVDVDDVEAAGAELQLDRGDVDDDLVTLSHLPHERHIGPGRAPLAVDVDRERVHGGDGAAPQGQHQAVPTPAAIASHTASMPVRASAATDSSAVWFSRVPLASRTHSKPRATRALASLPPPVATSRGSKPQPWRARRASSTERLPVFNRY